MRNKYRYFIYPECWDSYSISFLACNNHHGIYFKKDGSLYNNDGNGFNVHWKYEEFYNKFKEVKLKEVLSLHPISQHEFIKKKLKIINIQPKISEEIKNKIINNLKESRAFNADSALKIEENNINFEHYDILAEQNLIKVYGFDKFYLP